MKKILLFALLIVFSCSKDEPPRYLLSVSASVGGVVSSTGGDYAEGKSVTIRATPDAEYQFVNWSNGSTQNPLTVTVMADQVLTANFAKVKYGLTLSTQGEGSISEELISSGRVDYNSGSVVRLTATPSVGYSFTGWTGDVISTSNPVEVDINSAKNITAMFDLIVVSLQVDTEEGGGVLQEVVSSGRSTNYNYGDTVRLTPQPAEGFDFISWSGDHTGEENPLELTLTESKTIQANFDYELFNRVVGKWKIRKKTDDKLPSWYMHSIIFRRNYSYTINSNVGQTHGNFDVKSNTEIELEGYGSISNVDLTPSAVVSTSPWSNFNFNINITGVFEGPIESDVVENYVSEVSETGEIIEKTYVPDDNFEQALIDLGYDDVMDDYVTSSNINEVTALEISDKNISDLTGIEDFLALQDLFLKNNSVSVLDLSNNINLLQLNADDNGLASLDVSSSSNLNYISAIGGQLQSLDVSNNVSLTELILNNNQLGSIDLSNNVNLLKLSITNNNLSSIDVSNNNNLTELGLSDSWQLSENTNQISSIDLSNNIDLRDLYAIDIGLTSIDLSNNINLIGIHLYKNQLTSINLSNNTKLTDIFLADNQLTTIDISYLLDLEYFNVSTNLLTTIDVSKNLKLQRLYVGSNPLENLDVSNNIDLIALSTGGNNFSCIKVNSDQLANIPSDWEKDESTQYLTECIDCTPESTVSSGALTQITTLGTPITPTEIILSSTCSDTTYTMSYTDNSVPGLIVSFNDNTINLSGAPALEGTYDYSILVESTNLTYNQTSSTTINGTITSIAPSLSSSLTSGPQSQTVTSTNSITNVVYTFSTNYTGPVNAEASNLPPGIILSFSNNVATLSGTATTSGTYNYSINVSAGSTNSSVQGTITVNNGPVFSVVAGGNGIGLNSNQLWYPETIFKNGDYIYIVDAQNRPGRVQKWKIGDSEGSTVANNLNYPFMCYVDSQSNIFVTDRINDKLKKFSTASSETPQLELTLESNSTVFNEPTGIIQQSSGIYYVSDMRNNRVIKWIEGQTTGTVLFGGNGQGSNSNQLYFPHEISFDSQGNTYVLDSGNYRVQKFTDSSGNGTTVAGGNGNGSSLNQIEYTTGFHVTSSGDIYISDRQNQRIVKWSSGSSEGQIILNSSSGFGSIYPNDIYVDETSGVIYFSDFNNHRVVKYILN